MNYIWLIPVIFVGLLVGIYLGLILLAFFNIIVQFIWTLIFGE